MESIQEKIRYLRGLQDMKAKDVDFTHLRTVVRDLFTELLARPSVSTPGDGEINTWYFHETLAWQLSNNVSDFLRNNRKLRGKNEFLDILAELVLDTRIGKGRQNYVSILGVYGRKDYGNVIGSLLFDVDVHGHAIDALYRARVNDYADQVSQMLAAEKVTWIRNAAKRYLAWCNNSSTT